jgi:hypothetical protein
VTTRNRKLLTVAAASALFFFLPSPCASARDRGFDAVVQAVSTTYHARQSLKFVSWFAGMATRFARPEGVKSLRMAIFEDQDFTPRNGEAEFEEAVESALKEDWRPFVRVRSKRDGERTSIYARESGKDVSLFIITLEETEAVVMEVKVSARKFAQMMDDPEDISGSLRDNPREESSRLASRDAAAPGPTLQRRDEPTAGNP